MFRRKKRANQGNAEEPLDETLKSFLDVLYGVYADQARRQGFAELRETEKTLEDIAWNAIVIGHPNRFEDMQDGAVFCAQLTRKLHQHGFLPAAALPYASTVLSGVLRFLWDSQNLAYLDPELAKGWTGTLLQAIADLHAHWSPPTGQPWFEVIRSFPHEVDERLRFLHHLTYWQVYDHLDRKLAEIEKLALHMIKQVQRQYPQSLDGCAAYIMGTLIEKNTFSPLQGSVPEDIGERLLRIYVTVSEKAEDYFQNYLWRGFEKVRNPEQDELSRWRFDT
jgi:hypothetical protein